MIIKIPNDSLNFNGHTNDSLQRSLNSNGHSNDSLQSRTYICTAYKLNMDCRLHSAKCGPPTPCFAQESLQVDVILSYIDGKLMTFSIIKEQQYVKLKLILH